MAFFMLTWLVAVDFGITRRLSTPKYGPAHHSVGGSAQSSRASGEQIHNRTGEDISMAKPLTLLFEVSSTCAPGRKS